MSFPTKGSQALYLYPLKWDSTKDKLLLSCLIDKIEECRPSPPHLSTHALIHAMLALNSQLQAGMSLNEVEERVEFLHERYICFKHLCKLKETQLDQQTNVIHATDEVWQRLFKENAFFRAYYHEGEPEFLQMCNLFGIHDVKRELSHTVIVIEDSSTVKKRCDSSDDEVTSPIPKPPVSRKLFVDDACSSVAPSVPNLLKGKVTVPWKSLKNKFCRPNAIPVKKKDGRDPDAGYCASSCASSSPFK
ncbi:uncharacterized protein LOC131003051 [Salvia miltiorrhiza]|uniref:uncharacterized protein LOC130992734 n=1 Tax=Salvia miltiorrhiza TaxID=226208 RepID=UPI0025ACB19D|nr:uncharacterized protein LOC130992734 [Salvia miltiorrhiza]XP_057785498.1 uncharacterized protein LOC131003051 [Salvia miltiorrhiza]